MSPLDRARRAAWRSANRLVTMHPRSTREELARAVRGRTVLVTGASFGIGEATARQLGAAGATVLLVARTEDRLAEVARGITAAGGTAHVHPVDLTDGDEIDGLVKRVLDEHGHVDVLVNNAGKSIRRSVELSYDRPQDFERTIGINYLAPVRLTLGLLPSMRARRSGHVVTVSTQGVRGMPPAPRWGAYQASKAALDVWMRSMALEVRGDGIATTNVYMGLVRTRMSAPTPSLRRVPAMSPDRAGAVVCDAIVRRPKSVEPWWTPLASATSSVLSGPIDAVLSAAFRRGEDTSSARGERD
ncbi:SDR family NAD(P)-dependent oxidoreductase [Amycolatopsis anabasis]|uniref:SDR family NAD(P)-dependent oxidoreductase n=1 Tax=Amycolatopsis anabasis TaxID=1840409 RepID=UPI00131B48BB|nr:SDR family NAD(P)-dependent oxidoreductase [Amycolatopsis anabasis]